MSTGFENVIETASASFRAHGAVVARNFLTPEACDRIRGTVEGFLARYAGRVNWEDESGAIVLLGSGYRGLDGAPALIKYPKPVAVLRGAQAEADGNMIDIYNADRIVPGLYDLFNDSFIRPLLSATLGEPVYLQTVNIYVSRSVINTRGYHYDTTFPWYKALLYLTDVLESADGPYSYVAGSHQPDAVQANVQALAARRARGEGGRYGDVHPINPAQVRTFLGPRGTLMLSDQCGAHRGLPQAEGRYRVVAVPSFISQGILDRMGAEIGFPSGPRRTAGARP